MDTPLCPPYLPGHPPLPLPYGPLPYLPGLFMPVPFRPEPRIIPV